LVNGFLSFHGRIPPYLVVRTWRGPYENGGDKTPHGTDKVPRTPEGLVLWVERTDVPEGGGGII